MAKGFFFPFFSSRSLPPSVKMNSELKIISSHRATMFLWLNQIYVTSTYLAITSDGCIKAAIWHEYGHVAQRKTMLAITMVSLSIVTLSILILEIETFLFLAVGFYLWACFLCRMGEFKSDEHALRHTDPLSMLEMLAGEGKRLDTKIAMLFYPLRFHPSAKRRLKNLGLSV